MKFCYSIAPDKKKIKYADLEALRIGLIQVWKL